MRPQSTSLPPNPCLTAILLVIKTRAGPRLVFHYPPIPSASSASTNRDPNWYGTLGNQTDDSDSADSDWSSGSEDGAHTDDGEDEDGSRSSRAGSKGSKGRGSSRHDTAGSVRSTKAKLGPGGSREELDEDFVETERVSESEVVGLEEAKDEWKTKEHDEREWETVLGFSADGLSMLLTPGPSFNKRKFEVGIEQFVFVGAPMFVREDGSWKKRRRWKKRESVDALNEDCSQEETPSAEQQSSGLDDSKHDGAQPDIYVDLEQVPGFESAYGHGLVSGAASDIGSENSTAAANADMTMFNIVFVLSPPSLEHHIRVDEMYDYVVKKFAKALKYEQAMSNYVSREARLIQTMKDKARESKAPMNTLWQNVLNASALAKAIAITFDQISNNKIAHINLGAGAGDASFQIPQAISTPYIPTATEPQMPGLWLTTATLADEDDADTGLSPHSALLLLEDDDTLLKEVESDGQPLAGPLSFFIRNLTPTKSLQKLSQKHSMSLRDVQLLARHLIYWRRARAIPPLRWQDTYVVSPNADMHALGRAIPAFATRFPTLPSLPKVLHMLSGPPRSYGVLMPSRDHRSEYMKILAWLMRGGWVTQLRTFGWVRVKPEVKVAVAEKIRKETKISNMSYPVEQQTYQQNGDRAVLDEDILTDTSVPSPPSQRSPDSRGLGVPELQISPYLSAYLLPGGPPSDASTTGSTSSGRTVVPSNISPLSPIQRPENQAFHRPSRLHINQSASPSSDGCESPSQPSQGPINPMDHQSSALAVGISINPADYDASLVHSPQKADALESLWIEHIGATFDYPDLKELWPLLLKYFDGRHALEEIPAREVLKKKRVQNILNILVKGGWLVTVRHW